MSNNSLPWDGSYIGDYRSNIIVHKWIHRKTNYYTLLLGNNDYIYCTMRCTNDSYPVVADKIKPLFGLPCRGTHRLTIGGKGKIIFYISMTVDKKLIRETLLNELPKDHPLRYDETFRKQVRDTILFREILGISSTHESSISIRINNNQELFPLSINELTSVCMNKIGMIKGFDRTIMKSSIYRNWFDDISQIHESFQSMLMSASRVDASFYIIQRVNSIIKEINPQLITYSSYISTRLDKGIDSIDDI